ncbi:MAG: RHS repeat-associated core domain-containing protein [Candidatus Dormibacterales bacterium]
MRFEACLLVCQLGALRADSAPGGASQWFTGVDSDVRTDLSDFPFREYSSIQGRWLSPDPAGLAAVNPANPQTWNAYAYVGNQPLSATDPTGLHQLPPTLTCSYCPSDFWTGTCSICDVIGVGATCTLDAMDTACGGIPLNGAVECPGSCAPIHTRIGGGQWAVFQATAARSGYVPVGPTLDEWDEERSWELFLQAQRFANANPAESYEVTPTWRGFAFQIQILGLPLDTAAAEAAGWLDPLTIFENGDTSWYQGDWWSMFNVPHTIDDPGGIIYHVDPFGPLNPLHFLIQVIGGWLGGTERLPTVSCSLAAGGCSLAGGG